MTIDGNGPPRHDVPRGGRSGFVTVDERQVHYLEWGSSTAPPLVCLHGGGQTAYMWEELGDALRGRYHLLAPDLPWHGDSDPIDDMSRQTIAASLPPLLREFGYDRAAFVGASLGGIVSLTLAAASPDVVGAVALIDIGHRLEDEGVNRIIEFMTRRESFASLEEARPTSPSTSRNARPCGPRTCAATSANGRTDAGCGSTRTAGGYATTPSPPEVGAR